MRRFRLTALLSAALLAVGLLAAPAAQADSISPDPPGANDWTCKPSAVHPYPVVLVPGTFETMYKNWAAFSPVLKDQGYCVFSLNYGVVNGLPATAHIPDSAAELSTFVTSVLGATGAKQVDLVGHSQGGMMPRYYMGFLGGAKYVHHLVGIAPSSHGTTTPLTAPTGVLCDACADQAAGSAFITQLSSIGDTVAGPSYTVISTKFDEVVTPYTSQALAGSPRQVTNLVLQDYCPLDTIGHDQSPNDANVWSLVSNALLQSGPADPSYRPVCV